jgi:hypothetical protein
MNELFDRPQNESAYTVLPIGYPAGDETIPQITKKDIEEISLFY